MSAALPFVTMGLSAIGTGMGVFGALSQGRAESGAALAQAKLGRLQADAEVQRGDAEADAMRREARALIGRQRAGYSAAGVRLEGTPLLVVADTLSQSEQDIANLNKQTDARALAYRFGARSSESTASSAITGSYWKAGSSLLTGGAGIAGQVSTWLNRPQLNTIGKG